MEKLVFSIPQQVLDLQYYFQHTLIHCLFHKTEGLPLAFHDVTAGFDALRVHLCSPP